jgi:pilus assembly protein CpaE
MTTIVMATADAAAVDRVRRLLGSDGRVINLPKPLDGASQTNVSLLLSAEPDVILLGQENGLDLVCRLAEAVGVERPSTAVVVVARPSAPEWPELLRAGVTDVLDPEASDDELLETLVVRSRRRARVEEFATEVGASPGRVLTVMSAKGGSGKTMMSTNLAQALSAKHPGQVVVVDLDLQFGDVAAALRLHPEYTVVNALSALGDPTALKSFLTPHGAGFFCLCAPTNPAHADGIDGAALGKLLRVLRDEFAFVVVDTGAGLDEATLTAVEAATDVVMLTTTDLAAVQAMRKTIALLDQVELVAHRRWYVLNRANAKVGLTKDDIETAVGVVIDTELPSSRAVPMAMNQGLTVLQDEPKDGVAKGIDALARALEPVGIDERGRRLFRRGR